MFEELYAPLPDAGEYLERIGLPGLPRKCDLETLDQLLYAHVHTVPFENLDAWAAGKAPSLSIRRLYQKIVRRRRGGWCHELNALLRSLLTALGFEAYTVAGRVTTMDFVVPLGHRAVIAVLDGKKYYCDVGFGDVAFQSAVALDGTPSPFGFHIEKNGGWYEVWQGEDPRRRLLAFPDLALEPVDFLYANRVSATDPAEHFRNTLYISLMRGDKRLLLENGTLTEQGPAGGKTVIAEIDTADRTALGALLKTEFGIEYAFDDHA